MFRLLLCAHVYTCAAAFKHMYGMREGLTRRPATAERVDATAALRTRFVCLGVSSDGSFFTIAVSKRRIGWPGDRSRAPRLLTHHRRHHLGRRNGHRPRAICAAAYSILYSGRLTAPPCVSCPSVGSPNLRIAAVMRTAVGSRGRDRPRPPADGLSDYSGSRDGGPIPCKCD